MFLLQGVQGDFACLMFRSLVNRPTEDRILEMVKGALEIWMLFVTEALPANLIGMNYGLMSNTLSMW